MHQSLELVDYLQVHCKGPLGDLPDELVSSLAYSNHTMTMHQPNTAEITIEKEIRSCAYFPV